MIEPARLPLRCTCCGCTDEQACEGGCSWLIRAPVAICSACAPGARLKRALRFLAVYFETQAMIASGREANLRQAHEALESRNARMGRKHRHKEESK
jgi:hypothetical protein